MEPRSAGYLSVRVGHRHRAVHRTLFRNIISSFSQLWKSGCFSRVGRAVDGAGLILRKGGNPFMGSNPILSAESLSQGGSSGFFR